MLNLATLGIALVLQVLQPLIGDHLTFGVAHRQVFPIRYPVLVLNKAIRIVFQEQIKGHWLEVNPKVGATNNVRVGLVQVRREFFTAVRRPDPRPDRPSRHAF